MRIIALEIERSDITPDAFQPHLAAEARAVWKLVQADFIREIYFRADQTTAVLILECDSLAEAHRRLAELPLVAAGLIEFDLLPLVPYPGFERLFSHLE